MMMKDLKKSLVKEDYEESNVWHINPETKSKHLAYLKNFRII